MQNPSPICCNTERMFNMENKCYMEKINTAAQAIESVCGKADIAVVLGSGLGGYVDALEDAKSLPYSEIPGFPYPPFPATPVAGGWALCTASACT